jgi:hypothetical protein
MSFSPQERASDEIAFTFIHFFIDLLTVEIKVNLNDFFSGQKRMQFARNNLSFCGMKNECFPSLFVFTAINFTSHFVFRCQIGSCVCRFNNNKLQMVRK